MKHFSKIAFAAAAVLLAAHAGAQVVTIPDAALTSTNSLYTNDLGSVVVMTGGGNDPGIGNPTGRNDDGFSGPIDLGFSLNFFGQTYTQFYINNNGNITFNGGVADYTPSGPQGTTQPVIAPFFADVDTRGTNSGVVYVNTSIPDEVIVTWDHVGYYDTQSNLLDTFQLVLRGSDFATPAGQGQIGFFYGDMQWEEGTVSQTPAAVGFGDGNSNGEVLQGSIQPGIDAVVNDSYIWFDVTSAGTPVVTAVPEPENLALMLGGLAALVAVARRRKA